MLILENVIDDLVEEYEKAKRYGYVIEKPISYALRQVCKKYEELESKCFRNGYDKERGDKSR